MPAPQLKNMVAEWFTSSQYEGDLEKVGIVQGLVTALTTGQGNDCGALPVDGSETTCGIENGNGV